MNDLWAISSALKNILICIFKASYKMFNHLSSSFCCLSELCLQDKRKGSRIWRVQQMSMWFGLNKQNLQLYKREGFFCCLLLLLFFFFFVVVLFFFFRCLDQVFAKAGRKSASYFLLWVNFVWDWLKQYVKECLHKITSSIHFVRFK